MKTINRLGIAALKSIAAKPIATRDRTRDVQAPYSFPAKWTGGSTPDRYSFTIPLTGYWKFVAWGAGAPSNGYGGGSGAYGEVSLLLVAGEIATITPAVSGWNPPPTTIVLRGITYSAGSTGNINGGVASGPWDLSYDGSLGGADAASQNGAAGRGDGGGSGGLASGDRAGGAGAPGKLPFRGGNGGGANNARGGLHTGAGGTPGGGAGFPNTSMELGGDGLALAVFVRS